MDRALAAVNKNTRPAHVAVPVVVVQNRAGAALGDCLGAAGAWRTRRGRVVVHGLFKMLVLVIHAVIADTIRYY